MHFLWASQVAVESGLLLTCRPGLLVAVHKRARIASEPAPTRPTFSGSREVNVLAGGQAAGGTDHLKALLSTGASGGGVVWAGLKVVGQGVARGVAPAPLSQPFYFLYSTTTTATTEPTVNKLKMG